MKKKLVVLAAAICSVTAMKAQQHVTFGLKGGVNIANVNTDIDDNYDSRIGLHAGGVAHIHLSRNWALQPEILYSAQGFEDGSVKWKLDYVNIPLMLQYMFDNGFRLETGPQLGLMVNAKAESGNVESDQGDVFKSTDVSWGFGLNYLTRSQVGFGGRYNLGLTDITEPAASDFKNRVFQISLFYMFDKAHKR